MINFKRKERFKTRKTMLKILVNKNVKLYQNIAELTKPKYSSSTPFMENFSNKKLMDFPINNFDYP